MFESSITALEAIAVPTAVLPKSKAFNSPTTAVIPSKTFNSAAVLVTPSKIFNSAAVLLTAVPLIERASVSKVPSMSTSPETSKLPASSSPVSVIFLKLPISLLLSTTTPKLAETVPAVTPSKTLSSAGVAEI